MTFAPEARVSALKRQLVRFVFDRYISWRLEELVSPAYPVVLDFPVDPVPRYGYGKPPHARLNKIIGAGTARYQTTIEGFLAECGAGLSAVAVNDADANSDQATFINGYFSGLDAIALYGFLSRFNPSTYFEIGSGFSTRFARQAILDHGLGTTIVSCDPNPRAGISKIADQVIRQPLEKVDPANFRRLKAGDILFFDGSHRCFTNSDVSVLFLEILPLLDPGVLIHIHDILLPYDYPPEWSDRYYSEQYVLASYLIGGADIEIVLPNAFVGKDPDFAELLEQFWQLPGMAAVKQHTDRLCPGYVGNSFWFRQRDRRDAM